MSELIRLLANPQQIRGVVWGLQQSAWIGRLAIARVPAGFVDEALQRIQPLVGEPAPALPAGLGEAGRLAHLFASWSGALQRQSRIAVSETFAVHPVSDNAGALTVRFALPSPDTRATQVAAGYVLAAINRLAAGAHRGPEEATLRDAALEQLRPFANPGLNRFSIVTAALQLRIPLAALTDRVMVLGTGARSRWMDSTVTDVTPMISVAIARQKNETARALRMAGLPGPLNVLVASDEEAIRAARELGFPVVVKPADRDQGRGVAADLRDDAAVARGYEAARVHSAMVLVEKWFPGFTHRLTIYQGAVLRVTRRLAGGVVGDGINDITALVAAYQRTERQQRMERRFGKPLVEVDEEARGLLEQDGRTPAYVPAQGEYVRLRRRDNVNAGGTNEDLEGDAVHPDNLRLAIDAARLLRLDFAGIDLIMRDISKSWLREGALICEVNAQPQLGTSSQPDAYEKILPLFMRGQWRIPAQLSLCPSDARRRQAALEQVLALKQPGGVSDVSGLWVDGLQVSGPFADGFLAARALLLRTEVTNAVCLMTAPEIINFGLPLDHWDGFTVSNILSFSADERAVLTQVKQLVQPHVQGAAA